MHNIKLLLEKLIKIEKQLESVRGCSPLTHGWQNQRYAKSSRRWDILAQERMKLVNEITSLDGQFLIDDDFDIQLQSDCETTKNVIEFYKNYFKKQTNGNK